MKYTDLFLTLLLWPALVVAQAPAKKENQLTFVIVHVATGGGWDWKEVDQKLSEKGHRVYRPTLTGLGERVHLANPSIDLTTHINDVVNTLVFEELTQVVLVGHSYGGMVITGVMDRVPERIQHTIFLDAAVPDDGMSAIDVWGAFPAEHKVIDGMVHFAWIDTDKAFPRDVVQSFKTYSQPVSYDNPLAKKIDVSYVAFVPDGTSVEVRSQDPSWHRAEKRGWSIRTFAGDHVVYRQKPREFVEMLIDATKDRNNAN